MIGRGATVQGEWVRLNGRSMRAFVDPIGIDAESFRQDAERSVNDKLVQRVAGSLAGRALAIGVDRMDYSKGLPQRLKLFLEVPPVTDARAVYRLAHLFGAGRAHRTSRLVKTEAAGLEGQPAMMEKAADVRLRVANQVFILKMQHFAR